MKRFIFGFIFFVALFHLNYGQVIECPNEKVRFTVVEDNGSTIKILAEKTQNSNFTVYPPGAGGSLLILTGATCSDGRDKGVGPQVNASSNTWTFTRTSGPVTLKFKYGTCGTLTINEPHILPCAAPNDQMRIVLTSTDGTTATVRAENSSGQFTLLPPGMPDTILELENATTSAGNEDGVGPQHGHDPKIWTFTKIDASKPAYLRWKKRTDGTPHCDKTEELQF